MISGYLNNDNEKLMGSMMRLSETIEAHLIQLKLGAGKKKR